MNRIWKRAMDGLTTAVVGVDAGEPPEDYPLLVVAVRCDLHEQPLGPLLEARAELARWLGWEGPLDEAPRRAPQPSPRSQLLGERGEAEGSGWLLDSFRRLGTEAEGGVAILFEDVERADHATLEVLRRAVRRRGWLRIPLVLELASEPRDHAAGELLAAVEQIEGAAGVIRGDVPRRSESPSPVAIPAAIPPEVLRALRAAATIGPSFDVPLVASLLGLDPLAALELLQYARDAGVPLDDRGDGRLRWPRAWAEELRRGVLPSLAAAWHDRLAELLEPFDQPADLSQSARIAPPPGFATSAGRDLGLDPAIVPQRGGPVRPAPRNPTPPRSIEAAQPPPRPSSSPNGTLVPIEAAPPTEAHLVPDDQTLGALEAAPGTAQRGGGHDARAARHLAEAGKHDLAVERFLAASEDAARRGSNRLAIDYGKEALAILARLPVTARRRMQRIDVLARLGRLQWEAAGPGSDFTLSGALEVLEQALALVREGDPVHVAADLRALVAGVCYDLGDPASLEQALAELTRASKDLHGGGDALGAARLFNDQAAVWVRLGDPVRANHLLNESRAVFERLAAEDPKAWVEIAETDHLIARLPLHVRPRPGREADAIEMGLEHARDAERRYTEMGATREAARVWETMGRLELKGGDGQAAAEHLTRAVDLQSKLGDVLGLARTSEALAEVLAAGGRVEDALVVLGDSIELNMQKGSPLGLAYNRRAFERFQEALDPSGRNTLAQAIDRVATQLGEAEAVLGRVDVRD